MASLGSLVVSLGLDAAEFTSGLTKAEYQARKFGESFGKGIQTSIRAASIAITAMSATAGAAALAIDRLVKGAAEFKDLEETTGASAEGLASMAVAAETAGVAMDSIAANSIRLTKNLTGVNDDSKAAGAALTALGLNVKEFKALDPVAQIDALAKAFSGFADGPEKAAVATAIFGKSGAEMLKVFKALEEQGGRTKILTQEQINQADAYADAQAQAAAELKAYLQVAATQAAPALTELTKVTTDFIKELIGVGREAGNLRQSTAIKEFAQGSALAIAGLVDQLKRAVLDIAAFSKSTQQELKAIEFAWKFVRTSPADLGDFFRGKPGELATLRDEFKKLSEEAAAAGKAANDAATQPGVADALRKRFESGGTGGNAPLGSQEDFRRSELEKQKLKTLKYAGVTPNGGRDDATRKLLENELSALEAAIRREQDLMATRNRFLDLANDQNLISIRDYYDARRVIVQEGTDKQIAILDKEIASLEKFRAKASKQTEKEDATGKINKLLEERAELERKAGEIGIEFAIRQAKEERELAKEFENINAQVLELQGNLKAAAVIRFDQQNEGLRNRFTAEGNQAALRQLDTLRSYTIAQADFNQKSEESQRILDGLQAAEDRIQISRQLGSISELDALSTLGEARQAAVAQLEAIVRAQEEVARASGNPALIANAEKARVALERLRAEADPLAQKFNTIFKDSAASAFEGFLNGTKSAKEAFRDFVGDVVSQINRITAQQLSEAIFGGGGGLFGDLGKFITGFGGGTASGGGSGIGSFISTIGSFFGFGKAIGGPVLPGMMYEVNERRPELLDVNGRQFLMMGNQRGNVIPNPRLGGNRSTINNISISVPETTTRASATQLAAEIQRRLSAGSRNM